MILSFVRVYIAVSYRSRVVCVRRLYLCFCSGITLTSSRLHSLDIVSLLQSIPGRRSDDCEPTRFLAEPFLPRFVYSSSLPIKHPTNDFLYNVYCGDCALKFISFLNSRRFKHLASFYNGLHMRPAGDCYFSYPLGVLGS